MSLPIQTTHEDRDRAAGLVAGIAVTYLEQREALVDAIAGALARERGGAMTTVYVVLGGDQSGWSELVGAFSSAEDARDVQRAYEHGSDPTVIQYEVQSVELDVA